MGFSVPPARRFASNFAGSCEFVHPVAPGAVAFVIPYNRLSPQAQAQINIFQNQVKSSRVFLHGWSIWKYWLNVGPCSTPNLPGMGYGSQKSIGYDNIDSTQPHYSNTHDYMPLYHDLLPYPLNIYIQSSRAGWAGGKFFGNFRRPFNLNPHNNSSSKYASMLAVIYPPPAA